jgi:hypothetical protein
MKDVRSKNTLGIRNERAKGKMQLKDINFGSKKGNK